MFTADKITEIFFMADEFNKVFCRMLEKYGLKAPKENLSSRWAPLCARGYDYRDIVSQLWLSLPEAL